MNNSEKFVVLATGEKVSSQSEAWRRECEANHYLAKMIAGTDFNIDFQELIKIRGVKQVAILCKIMRYIAQKDGLAQAIINELRLHERKISQIK